MYTDWEKLQKVDIGSTEELCRHCNADLTDIANFIFKNELRSEPRYWQELCECQGCDTQFIMHYDIFDSGGHIYQRVFSEDVNDLEESWVESLSEGQRVEVQNHLENCEVCKERLSQEQLGEALVKEFMQNLRKRLKGKGR